MNEDLKVPAAIVEDLKLALLEIDPVGKIVKAIEEGLDATKYAPGHDSGIEDYPTRLNYAKWLAEICHFVKPSDSADSVRNLTDDEIIQLFESASPKDSPDTEPA